jgi:hypothetical protein
MAAPTTTTNKHGKVIKVGDSLTIRGDVTAVSALGVVTLRLEDPYINTLAGLATVNVNAYQLGN